jgi:hypothetical protein
VSGPAWVPSWASSQARLEQFVGPLAQVDDPQAELLGADHVLIVLVAQGERVLEDLPGGVRDARLPRDRIGDQLPGPPKEMGMAGLMLGVGEPPVGSPPVALQPT